MNKEIHFFDLDGTLWDINTKGWIIDKKNPTIPLIKLTKGELSEIINGIYRDDDIVIEYNGDEYWISEEMFNKIKKLKKNIIEKDLGLSFIEMNDYSFYKDMKIYKNNFKHLIEKDNYDFGILSARNDIENDEMLLKALENELENVGIKIDKLFYVCDFFKPITTLQISYKKLNILLEHLMGFKIKNDHFIQIKQDRYDVVHFYDDDPQNIEISNDIQKILELYLRNTEEEVFDRILKNINNYKPILYTHLITNNKNNLFKTNKIEINLPTKFPIKIEETINIKKFLDFRNIK
jgi:hypothetical protein